MFNLFTALFGGLYYSGKIANEKSKIKEADEQNKSLINNIKVLQSLYGADINLKRKTEEFVRCGNHYEEICDLLKDDLEYVLGSDWKRVLNIPKGSRDGSSFLPAHHNYWVYHLLLSKSGKMDDWEMSMGYPWNTIDTKERNKKFMYCIEKNLINAGVHDIKLVCESRPNGQLSVKPEQCCTHSSYRLW